MGIDHLQEQNRKSFLIIQYNCKFKSNSTPQPLSDYEIERLIHEASQTERMMLENAVSDKILLDDNFILSKINERFSILIMNDKKFENNFKMLL